MIVSIPGGALPLGAGIRPEVRQVPLPARPRYRPWRGSDLRSNWPPAIRLGRRGCQARTRHRCLSMRDWSHPALAGATLPVVRGTSLATDRSKMWVVAVPGWRARGPLTHFDQTSRPAYWGGAFALWQGSWWLWWLLLSLARIRGPERGLVGPWRFVGVSVPPWDSSQIQCSGRISGPVQPVGLSPLAPIRSWAFAAVGTPRGRTKG